MADTSIATSYVNRLIEIFGPIVFDSSTLATKNILKDFQKSIKDKPNTEINIYPGNLGTTMIESKLNRKSQAIMIRIQVLAENREQQAQSDLNYLTEQIVDKLEDSFNDSVWQAGWLDNNNIVSTPRTSTPNHYTVFIPVSIKRRRTVPN